MKRLVTAVFLSAAAMGLGSSSAERGPFTAGQQAASMAWAISTHPAGVVVPVKVKRSECRECNGTGRIRTGDGISWSECDNCEPDASALSVNCECEECECVECRCEPAKPTVQPVAMLAQGHCAGGACAAVSPPSVSAARTPASGSCGSGSCGSGGGFVRRVFAARPVSRLFARRPIRRLFGR